MSKLTKQEHNAIVNKRPPLEQLNQDGSVQLILSPFVHLFNINEMTKCLFNSLTLQKVYLNNEKYDKILTDLSIANQSDEVKSLVKLKFLVLKVLTRRKCLIQLQTVRSKKSLLRVSRMFW